MFSTPMLDSFKTACVLMRLSNEEPDGQGGTDDEWSEVATLDAVFGRETAAKTVSAEKPGVTTALNIYVPKDTEARFQDVIRRVEDNACFQVIGSHRTPNPSMIDWKCVKTERVEMPT